MGDSQENVLWVRFDSELKLEFHGSKITKEEIL